MTVDTLSVVATDGCGVLASKCINNLENLTPCSQEEADTDFCCMLDTRQSQDCARP